ncbi:hypothetical protein GCM10010177_02550 [Actinomadura citrea]|nr:hypothetical protein GCM10010177_02550 [Actinomadura citrea]
MTSRDSRPSQCGEPANAGTAISVATRAAVTASGQTGRAWGAAPGPPPAGGRERPPLRKDSSDSTKHTSAEPPTKIFRNSFPESVVVMGP